MEPAPSDTRNQVLDDVWDMSRPDPTLDMKSPTLAAEPHIALPLVASCILLAAGL